MRRNNILSPSLLAADFTNLKEQLEQIEEGGAQYLHLDVMDGKFVPAISFGMPVIETIRKASNLVFDVHLMIEEPIRYIEEFARIGADSITIHLEACSDVDKTINKIRECGKKVGISIKPGTNTKEIIPYLNRIDMVLIMCVEPGFGGQKFIEASMNRIREIRERIIEKNYDVDIEVDGGITIENVTSVIEAGANVIVAGSAIFGDNIKGKTEVFIGKMKGIVV